MNEPLIQQIKKNLFHLFNTRRGLVTFQPLYGLPDVLSILKDIPYGYQHLTKAMGECITLYEKRIKSHRIKLINQKKLNGSLIVEIELSAILYNQNSFYTQGYFLMGEFSFEGAQQHG